MKTAVVLAKIESLSRCIHRIEAKRPASAEALSSDLDLQDIVVVNLERAVQISVDIASIVIARAAIQPPSSMADAFQKLGENKVIPGDLATRLQKAVGFRNIAVHEYQRIDWDRVFSLVTAHLDDFREFSRIVMKLFKVTP